jgi:glycosyltransferase involved in cell wall biosynthesis
MASVDVVVPCYQYGRFLRDCVASALSQQACDVRVLIIDNASTDNSLEVARELAAEDSRVEVVAHRTNLGHLASFNEGVDWASADYFIVLCADDMLAPGCLARAVSLMERHPDVVLTYGAALLIGADDALPSIDQDPTEAQWRILPGRSLLDLCCRSARCHIPGSTAVVRTSAQKQVGHYRPALPHTNDLEVWLRFACVGAIAETDAVQGVCRGHPANRCSSVPSILDWNLHFEAAFESFFAHEGALLPDATRLQRAARRTLGERAYWGAVTHLLRGDTQLSFNLLRFAVTRWPASMVIPPFGYLLRRENAIARIAQVMSEAAKRLSGPLRGGRHSR